MQSDFGHYNLSLRLRHVLLILCWLGLLPSVLLQLFNVVHIYLVFLEMQMQKSHQHQKLQSIYLLSHYRARDSWVKCYSESIPDSSLLFFKVLSEIPRVFGVFFTFLNISKRYSHNYDILSTKIFHNHNQ